MLHLSGFQQFAMLHLSGFQQSDRFPVRFPAVWFPAVWFPAVWFDPCANKGSETDITVKRPENTTRTTPIILNFTLLETMFKINYITNLSPL